MGLSNYENALKKHTEKERKAVELNQIIGSLMYQESIELVLFRNSLVNQNVPSILKLHKKARSITHNTVSISESLKIAKGIASIKDLAPSKIDIGKLTSEWDKESSSSDSLNAFLQSKLGAFIGVEKRQKLKSKDIVVYGFGRIGRLVVRELINQFGKGEQLRLRAIVTRKVNKDILEKRAALLRNDSVHKSFNGTIEVDSEKSQLIINGQIVYMIAADAPESINYTSYDNINEALLIDSTGVFTDSAGLSRHLEANGISKVLLTAPGKEIPNIVYGINEKSLNLSRDNIISAASCTTNAISPILYIIENKLGIEKGHVETIHAYTNDQNLLDNFHKKPRRGRSSAINMVITSTGAGKAVTKVIPNLKNKLTANAIRVPTPNGSIAIISANVKRETSLLEVNEIIRHAALEGTLVNQIEYELDPETVSNDIVGRTCCSVFDSNATIVSEDKKNIVLYVWYDNEFGYTKQVIRLAKYIAQVRRHIYY